MNYHIMCVKAHFLHNRKICKKYQTKMMDVAKLIYSNLINLYIYRDNFNYKNKCLFSNEFGRDNIETESKHCETEYYNQANR